MSRYVSSGAGLEDHRIQVLWEDGERTLSRASRADENRGPRSVLTLRLAAESPPPASVDRLAHEYGLKDHLESAWAARPLEFVRDRALLILADPGGDPLERHLCGPTETTRFLQLATGITAALRQVHQQGLVHRDLKPAHILVDGAGGDVHLTGFGLASRLPRERRPPGPPEVISGTLAYMAPEQTGRMNRSIDSRSDLYALGVIFYQMLTGVLPFIASDPLEWIHCHIARTPVPPHERVADIPSAISHIVTKLLAKTAEDRYQTAAGVERDLRRCLADWQATGQIGRFLPGETDLPDRLSIPEKLYGRARDIETLLAAFDRVIAGNRPELVLVSGYSGIGKSAVVNELHKALVPPRALFASGKFDQYKRDIPYATLAQAFQSLIRPLLGKSEADLHDWRQALGEALGPNGQLIANLVPELKLIMGEQPPIPDLSPQDAQARFQLVFRRFLGVFARQEHPLALFLDDLQWLDLATLDLIEDLLCQSDAQHLLLIAAYRDNEVNSSHPLMRKLEAMRQAGAMVREITLAPLTPKDLGALLADAFRCASELVAPLAHLVHGKTGGNPFFATQFITALVDEDLLAFDHGLGRWSWDLSRIQAKSYTDNVVDLMAGKINRLPMETQEAIKELSCLGNTADISTISIVRGTSEEQVRLDLWEAIHLDLIVRLEESYKFVHDRIQEAAYSLIPEQSRAEAHLRIGRLLAARTPPQKQDEAVFEIVNQLNRGAALIISPDEREHLAELNLVAGKRAKASAAYASAVNYLIAGAALEASDSWERRHDLAFALEFHRAECEFLTGELTAAEKRLTMLATRAANTVERATVECLRIDLYTTLDQTDHAVAACLDYLRHLGGEWSPHPTEEEARREYQRVWSQLGSREIGDLIDLPLLSDPASLATLDVLTKIFPTAIFIDENLLCMTVCRAVNLSLERGNSDASCVAYVYFGKIAGPRFGDYKAAFQFGQLGYDLVEKRHLARFQARTYLWFAQFVLPWTKHVKACRGLMERAFDVATKVGDRNIAVYSLDNLNTNFLAAGDPLVEAQRQAEIGLEFAEGARFGHQIDIIATQLGLVSTLRGFTPEFGWFDDGQPGGALVERHYTPNPAVYWIRKLQARFLAADYRSALDAAAKAQPMLWTMAGFFETAEYHFYAALSHAASCASAVSDRDGPAPARPADGLHRSSHSGERQHHLAALTAHHKRLAVWAENCPENFLNRAALVGAEIARLDGRELDAERLYEQAIHSARASGFIHNEAVAYETAARFYAERGLNEIAQLYLRNARYGYLRWGADGKVRQLDDMFPQLGKEGSPPGSTSTIDTPVDHLDLATVIKVSQTISREIVLETLIDTVMRTAIEQAGAERGVLMLARGGELWCVADAITGNETITVDLRDEPAAGMALPQSVLQYVLRTQDPVVLDDAAAQQPFAADPYIRQRQGKSILCLPLLAQAKLSGLLYLENNLAPHVFVQARTAILKLLASQAAIALENAGLYRDVAEREAKIRRLVDANIIGTFIWQAMSPGVEPDGLSIIEANDAFLRMVGYEREDLAAGRLSTSTLIPPGWYERHTRNIAEVRMTGSALPVEKEYLRKDGSRVPVLVGVAAFDQQRDRGVAFVVDLTERKHGEEVLRHAADRLAQATQAASLAELSASIAHEVNQPLAAIVANSHACQRWLSTEPPNLERAKITAERIARDATSAADVVSRIRALFHQAPHARSPEDLNRLIGEVCQLMADKIAAKGVRIETELDPALPSVALDRVQVQQVLVNLVRNGIEAMDAVADDARSIQIRSRRDGPDTIRVEVRDAGAGFKDPERALEPFFTTKPQGMGMGLVICRSIVESHGGRLWPKFRTLRIDAA
ncbi:MAG: trifunctional serine/threonine-protein kinase/ATP-binding protein/sensor histidine kinase [Inquilinus sp.]|uniref:trifunctional serine/threonine-protein kinase/ATP-binding protein/sensor histidine kinase n=1 Tax=Inquilinus sp. TaxID=1932117 RepID=UPI003F3229E8